MKPSVPSEKSSDVPGNPPAIGPGRRLLAVLTVFTDPAKPLNAEEISERLSIPRSTVYRFLALLREFDLVEDSADGRCQLGPAAVTLGYAARATANLDDMWRPAMSAIAEQSGESVLVLRRMGTHAVCVDRIESRHPVRLSFEIGRVMPLHTGAGAKLLLSETDDDFVDEYQKSHVPTGQRRNLKEDLKLIRERRRSESQSEVDPGIWAVAVPLMNSKDRHYCITVALPEYRASAEVKDEVTKLLDEGTAELRGRLAQMH
jgi:DNA-binding IclR family transcriptional regulator